MVKVSCHVPLFPFPSVGCPWTPVPQWCPIMGQPWPQSPCCVLSPSMFSHAGLLDSPGKLVPTALPVSHGQFREEGLAAVQWWAASSSPISRLLRQLVVSICRHTGTFCLLFPPFPVLLLKQLQCGAGLRLHRQDVTFAQVSPGVATSSLSPSLMEPWSAQLLTTPPIISSLTPEVSLSYFIFRFHCSTAERYLHLCLSTFLCLIKACVLVCKHTKCRQNCSYVSHYLMFCMELEMHNKDLCAH